MTEASKAQDTMGRPPVDKNEVPLIEVIVKANVAVGMPLHHFKIWPDGRTEGFDKLGAEAVVVNRVPMLLASIVNPMDEFLGTIKVEIRRLAADQQFMEPERPLGSVIKLDS